MLRCGLYFVQYRAAGHPISLLFRNMQVGDISVEEISRTMNLSMILLQSGSNVPAHCWEDSLRPIIPVVCGCIFFFVNRKPPILHFMRDWLLHHSQSLPGGGGPGYLCLGCSTGWGGMAKVWKDFASPKSLTLARWSLQFVPTGPTCDTITSRGLHNNNNPYYSLFPSKCSKL